MAPAAFDGWRNSSHGSEGSSLATAKKPAPEELRYAIAQVQRLRRGGSMSSETPEELLERLIKEHPDASEAELWALWKKEIVASAVRTCRW